MTHFETNPNCFTHKLRQWTIEVSLSFGTSSKILFVVNSKTSQNVSFRGELMEEDLNKETKNFANNFT